jgi:Ca2+-binding RTX toxin-like protein
VNGTAHLGGATLDLSFVNGFHPLTGERFDILSSSNPVAGTFAGLPDGQKFHAHGVTWKISYHGGSGHHDVVLTAVLAGVKIVIATPGPHLIDATHTVAGQPLPTNYGDRIVCQTGNNTVHAGSGPDQIVAGPGRDVLFGGAGANTFIFLNDNTNAHIHNFAHGVDKLELAKSVFVSAAHIHYDTATGALVFSENRWGPSVQFATLAPHLHFTDGDLLFV